MTRSLRIALACLLSSVLLPTYSAQAAPPTPSADVKAAAAALDSWSGQPGILADARAKLDRALKKNPSDYLALKELARYYVMAGYIREREAFYGTHSYQVGEYEPGALDRAETTIRKAIQINPRFAEGYVLLGHILQQLGRIDEAAQALGRAESLGTKDVWLDANWAEVLEARGDSVGAAARWQRVLWSGTTNAKVLRSAYSYLIVYYRKAGQTDRVIALHEENIRRNPTNAWVRGNYAEYLLYDLGRFDEAIVQARAALAIMSYPIARKTLSDALYGKWGDVVAAGNIEKAEPYFKEAYSLNPNLDHVMARGAAMPYGKNLAQALVKLKHVDVDAGDMEDGSSALLIAVNTERAAVVKYLLELGASPNRKATYASWTPLTSAADSGNTEILAMLLAHGADLDRLGSHALMYAQRGGHTRATAMLREAMAKAR
jgi:Tfp pilus assembly protein PilF